MVEKKENPNPISLFENKLQTALKNANINPNAFTTRDRLALTLESASLNSADEIQAAILNPISTTKAIFGLEDKDEGAYYKSLAEIRQRQKERRAKGGTFGYDMLGGAITTLPAIAATPFTGGTSLTPLATNIFGRGLLTNIVPRVAPGGSKLVTGLKAGGDMALRGGALAGTSGFLKGEGGAGNRFISGAVDAPLGAVTNVLGETGSKLAFNVLPSFIRSMRTKFGDRTSNQVREEIERIMEVSGLDFDEVQERVGKGEVPADMNQNTRQMLKSYYSSASKGSGIIEEIAEKRSKETTEQAYDTIKKNLVNNLDTTESSVAIAVGNNLDQLQKLESINYSNILRPNGKNINTSNSLTAAMKQVLDNEPGIRNKLLKSVARNPNSPTKTLFTMKKGKIKFVRNPTIEEANRLDSLLSELARDNKGTQLELDIRQGVLNPYRKIFDNEVPDIVPVRNQYFKIKENRRLFDLARSSFNKNKTDEAVIKFNELLKNEDAEGLAVFRQGFAQAILDKKGSANVPLVSLLKRLNASEVGDLTTVERDLFKRFFPEDELEDALQKIKNASQANVTYSKVFQTTDTTPTASFREQIGSGVQTGADVIDLATGGGLATTFRTVGRLLSGSGQRLTKDQQTEVARLLMEENPQLLFRAMEEGGSASGRATEELQKVVTFLANRVAKGINIGVQQQGLLDTPKTGLIDLKDSLLGVQ